MFLHSKKNTLTHHWTLKTYFDKWQAARCIICHQVNCTVKVSEMFVSWQKGKKNNCYSIRETHWKRRIFIMSFPIAAAPLYYYRCQFCTLSAAACRPFGLLLLFLTLFVRFFSLLFHFRTCTGWEKNSKRTVIVVTVKMENVHFFFFFFTLPLFLLFFSRCWVFSLFFFSSALPLSFWLSTTFKVVFPPAIFGHAYSVFVERRHPHARHDRGNLDNISNSSAARTVHRKSCSTHTYYRWVECKTDSFRTRQRLHRGADQINSKFLFFRFIPTPFRSILLRLKMIHKYIAQTALTVRYNNVVYSRNVYYFMMSTIVGSGNHDGSPLKYFLWINFYNNWHCIRIQ